MALASGNGIITQNKSGAEFTKVSSSQDHTSDNNDIIVLGNKLEKYKQITSLAEAITRDLNFNNPLARYTSSICLDVVGLNDKQVREIKFRILNKLGIIKIPYTSQNCHANASVFFVDNTNAVMRSIYKKNPMLFGPIEYREVNKKLEETDKSIVIQNIVTKGVDGDPIIGKAVPSRSSSIIDLPIRKDIESSIVLINRNSVIGYSIDQIADFLAFRILANVQVPSTSYGKSILEMFNMPPSACPNGMTKWDISYLKEIYSGNGNLRGVRKIGQITRRMLREDN